MTCPICTNKPMNCDCSQEAKELYYLRQQLEENSDEHRQQERKRLFQEVALAYWRENCHSHSLTGNDGFGLAEVTRITEAILQASEEFAKEQE